MEPAHPTAVGPTDARDGRPALTQATLPQVCCDDAWEAAYLSFETPEQEVCKFHEPLLASAQPLGRAMLQSSSCSAAAATG